MRSKRVTLQTLAEELGVSKVAVSKALNGKAGVSEELRNNIVKLAQERGYSVSLKTKAESETRNILIFMHEKYFEKDDFFYPNFYKEITKLFLKKKNYQKNLVLLSEQVIKEKSIPSILDESNGCLIIGELEESFVRKIKETCPATVLTDFSFPSIDVDSVYTNNFYAMQKLTQLLIDNGHQKIMFVTNEHETNSIKDRYFGYQRALYDNGLFKPEMVNQTYCWETDKLNDIEELPTAFICNNDRAAMIITHELIKIGFDVPTDISVVGFDDTSYSTMLTPYITTMKVDIPRMAKEAVSLLENRINHPSEQASHIVLTPSLIERQTHSKVKKISE